MTVRLRNLTSPQAANARQRLPWKRLLHRAAYGASEAAVEDKVTPR